MLTVVCELFVQMCTHVRPIDGPDGDLASLAYVLEIRGFECLFHGMHGPFGVKENCLQSLHSHYYLWRRQAVSVIPLTSVVILEEI